MGIEVLQGPAAFVAHSKVVPVPHPVAEIVPVVDGQILFVMVIVGGVGTVQVPGTVDIEDETGLFIEGSAVQLHLVSIV